MFNVKKITLIAIFATTLISSALFAEKENVCTITNDVKIEKIFGKNVYTVTKNVKIEKPLTSGINFSIGPWRPWATEVRHNAWNDWYAMEPAVYRINSIATGGGTNFIENKKGAEYAVANGKSLKSGQGAGYWGVYPDNFWNGAQAHIYRREKDGYDLKEIRVDKVKKFYGEKGGEERIYLEGNDPAIKKGDVYVLTMERLKFPDVKYPKPNIDIIRRNSTFMKPTKGSKITWELDGKSFCQEGGSTASMKISMTGEGGRKGPHGLEHQYLRFGGKELDFVKGKKYKFQVWLRQEGLKGPVTVQLGDRFTKQVEVSNVWKKFEWDVPTHPIKKGGAEPLKIAADSKGTVWVDNMLVYQTDLKPFEIYPEWIEKIKEVKPYMIRDMCGRFIHSLDSLLTDGFQRKFTWNEKFSTGSGQGYFSLRQFLELNEKVGSNPYIMSYVLWNDEEIEHFMEYLGAPANVGYGKLRAKHGHPKPWTEVFDKIYIECANEMWNRNFAPQAYADYPEMAGLVGNRLFKRIKESKWNKNKKQFVCVASAFVNSLYRWKDRDTGKYMMEDRAKGWTLRCAENCPDLDALATAPSGYFGGWDGDTIVGQNDNDLFQTDLFYSPRFMEPKLKDMDALREVLMKKFKRTQPVELVKYEYGPGYLIPSPAAPFVENEERMQKTLPLGIATLDNTLFMNANNCIGNYFKVRKGNKWSSHSKNGIPHNAWLALKMRNIYCRGSLMKVDETKVATVDLPEVTVMTQTTHGKKKKKTRKAHPGMELTRLYAFKEGKRWSFIALNRSFTNPQKITINIPYSPNSNFKEYLLTTDDLRATNREEEHIKIIESDKKGFKNGYTFTLKPSRAVVIVNEENK